MDDTLATRADSPRVSCRGGRSQCRRPERAALPLHSKPAVGKWPWPAADKHGDSGGTKGFPEAHRAHHHSGRAGQLPNSAMLWTGLRLPLSGMRAAVAGAMCPRAKVDPREFFRPIVSEVGSCPLCGSVIYWQVWREGPIRKGGFSAYSGGLYLCVSIPF